MTLTELAAELTKTGLKATIAQDRVIVAYTPQKTTLGTTPHGIEMRYEVKLLITDKTKGGCNVRIKTASTVLSMALE